MPSNRKTMKRGRAPQCSPYSTEDYNSNDGMLTTVWGPSQWHFLHTMSFNYPVNPTDADKVHYRNHILGLRYVLPCGKCRANLTENFKKIVFSSTGNFNLSSILHGNSPPSPFGVFGQSVDVYQM